MPLLLKLIKKDALITFSLPKDTQALNVFGYWDANWFVNQLMARFFLSI